MFRKMRREKQALSKSECCEILQNAKRGVLCVAGCEGFPYGVPMNFFYDAKTEKIYFHSAKEGHKIESLKKNPNACFCVIDEGKKSEDWSYFFKSVVVFGKIRFVLEQSETLFFAKKFGEKYFPTKEELEEELKHAAPRVQILELQAEHISGKLVHEK